MTYAIGQPVAAADFMTFRGATAPNVAYPSAIAATNAIAALIGVGYGSRGYGQTYVTLAAVTSGSVITAAQWNSLYSAMSTIDVQTGSGLTIPASVTTSSVIQADTGTLSRPNLPGLITTLDTNRLLYSISQMALASKLTSVLTTPWTGTVLHQWTLTFASENAARYFFNTGGQVYASGSRTGGTGSHLDFTFTDLLNQMGTIKMGAVTTTYTGTGGTAQSIGYYGLTETFQTIFTHLGSAYGYTSASYSLQARVENVAGLNGANGTVVRMQAVFATGLSGYSYYYSVDGTLTSTVQQLAADVLVITAPIYATTTPL